MARLRKTVLFSLIFWPLFLGAILFLGLFLTQPLVSRGRERSPPPVAPERLKAHVRTLSEEFSPRDESHPANLDRAAAYIARELREAGGRVSEETYEVQGIAYRNVLARFGPEAGPLVLVGAHYDTCGALPGADDNASGVAGLIELAHLLGKAGPKSPVELAAFTLEEPPYFRSEQMGSAVRARALKEQGGPLRAMICLEMIGFFSDEPRSQYYPVSPLRLLYPSRGNYIAVVGRPGDWLLARRVKGAMAGASDLPVRSINAPGFVPGLDLSDHLNFWNAGYRAVMVTDTAFFRNDAYHEAGDTWDKLDYPRMAEVVRGTHAAVLSLAE